MRAVAPWLAFLCAGLCACATGNAPPRSAVPPRLADVRKVGVMPIEAAVTLFSASGEQEPGVDEQEEAVARLGVYTLRALRARGFDAVLLPLRDKLFATRPELRFQATQAQKSANGAIIELFQSADSVDADARMRGALPELQAIAAVGGVDALLFTRYEAFVNRMISDGAGDVGLSALGWFFLPQNPDRYGVVACLVDARTGRFLWMDSGSSPDGSLDRMAELALASFKR